MSLREARYEKIEFCSSHKTLWGKIESGRYDWLGVHPEGQFVLGSPPAARMFGHVATEVLRAGVERGQHGVQVDVPGGNPSYEWFATEAEAKAAYDARVSQAATEGTKPILLRIRRIEGTFQAEEEFIVHRPTTFR